MDKKDVISMFVENIVSDLKEWINNILINKEATDIHYLDSSLMSSCLQLQLQITLDKAFSSDEELELF